MPRGFTKTTQAAASGKDMEHSRRIMIVEDERIVAMDISSMLRRLGHEICAVACSGEEALRLVPEASPEVILMDIMLEGPMDGVEAARRIRRDYGIPVIYATAYTDEHTRLRAKETNPGGFLAKPVNSRSLEEAIQAVFDPPA